MELRRWSVVLLGLGLAFACDKEKKDGDEGQKLTIQPQILRLPLIDATGLKKPSGLNLVDPAAETSLMQSFTPSSIKLSVYDISISTGDVDDWTTQGYNIYRCSGSTNEECMVEVSNLEAFQDALNAKPVELSPGLYTKVRVGMCAVPGSKQTIQITGSATLNGVTYITHTTSGIVAGTATDATPVTFQFSGCGVQIPLASPLNAELSAEQIAELEKKECADCAPSVSATIGLRLLFDNYNFAAMGNMLNDATKQLVANAADNLPNVTFNADDSACKGDKAGLFICTQRTALFATDDKAPQIKRFNIALTDTESFGGRPAVPTPDPTAYTAVMLRSDGVPLAAYTRRSIAEGASFNRSIKGDENYWEITKNADDSFQMSLGALGGNQVDYAAFRIEDHTGERKALNGTDLLPYKATLIQ